MSKKRKKEAPPRPQRASPYGGAFARAAARSPLPGSAEYCCVSTAHVWCKILHINLCLVPHMRGVERCIGLQTAEPLVYCVSGLGSKVWGLVACRVECVGSRVEGRLEPTVKA
eukprot:2046981-Rhodomonas_salina.1